MSGKPHSTPIQHTIYKVNQHYKELRENIHLPQSSLSFHHKWLSQAHTFQQISYHNSLCILLWDVTINRFILFFDERNITGYDTTSYTGENGVDFSLYNFHPEHMQAVQHINASIHNLYMANSHISPDKIVANVDALYRIKNGSYIHILQQIVPVETDSSGRPFLFLSYGHNITHLKKFHSSSLIFTTPEKAIILKYCFAEKKLEKAIFFTEKEQQILQWLCKGKQTKEIAAELAVSPHTIDTHRRNLLAKTSCLDTTALVAYCKMVGLL
ncbi:MAG: helix-turn-helix transcriptional regulator [Bacteroidota bacterium]|nr:helix-turn-helix transcriptional regulator [Bacteroidota bacterium]